MTDFSVETVVIGAGVVGLAISRELSNITGEMLVFLKFMPIIQLFHLWIASWILGLISVQYVAWQRSRLDYE